MIGWRSFTHKAKTKVVKVAEMVKTKGNTFARPLKTLDQNQVDATLRRAEEAFKTPGVLPDDVVDSVAQVVLTYNSRSMLTIQVWLMLVRSLDHTSDEDPVAHSTGVLLNADGKEVGKVHVASNPAQQQPARLHQ